MENYKDHPEKLSYPGGETYIQVQNRVFEEFENILAETFDNIIIVSHVDALKMLIMKIMGIPISHKRKFLIENGSITTMIEDNGKLRIDCVNQQLFTRTPHHP